MEQKPSKKAFSNFSVKNRTWFKFNKNSFKKHAYKLFQIKFYDLNDIYIHYILLYNIIKNVNAPYFLFQSVQAAKILTIVIKNM